MPTPSPISLPPSLQAGQTATATNSTVGGSWSSSNTSVATVNSVTGVVSGLRYGVCNIVYTVGSDSIAAVLNVVVSTITNGINFNSVYNALFPRMVWQGTGQYPTSGRYYEDFHPLLNTQVLMAMLPGSPFAGVTDPAFLQALTNEVRATAIEVVNQVYSRAEIIDPAKLAFYRVAQATLYPQPVANTDAFCGLRFFLVPGDRAYKLSSVTLFFNQDATFNLYLYNDFTWAPFLLQSVTARAQEQVIVQLSTNVILNYLNPVISKGGIWYIGYYQQDLPEGCQAMYYAVAPETYHGIQTLAYSAPMQNAPDGSRNFQRNLIGSNNLTYGLNAEIEVYRDGTNNIVQNVSLLDDPMGYTMSVRMVKKLLFSFASNGIQRVIGDKSLEDLNRELYGFKYDENSPYTPGLNDMASRAITKAKKAFDNVPARAVGIQN